ncbi:kinase-like domain-containing protein [Rhizophagus irregularis DAOM 181602=DAOM 197198]|nr:kinase-like domain-containing protein [Rhizophagus irregularis DAOM 181602=DAOM 197198]
MKILDFRDLTAGKKIIAENFASWTSGNEIIDNFIQEKQLNYNEDAVFEWIPYSELMDIKEIGNNCLTTAIWKEGSLYYNKDEKEWIRCPYEIVTLRFLYDVTDESINKIKAYLTFGYYGVSQTPDTKVYILVFNKGYIDDYCGKCGNTYEKCQTNHLKDNFINWTSRNVILDAFIQKMQLKLNNYESGKYRKHITLAIWEKGPLHYNTNDNNFVRQPCEKVYLKCLHSSQTITVQFLNEVKSYLKNKIFEWIPYNEFTIIKELENYITLAMWEKGPLYYNTDDKKLVRKSREKVYLKHLYNSQEITDEFLNEVESYLKNNVIFGISQNPDTEVYLLAFNDEYFDHYCKKCAIRKDGPLYYSRIGRIYKRELNKKVILKYLYNSQNGSHLFLNEVIYSVEENYGITQNPNTKDNILVCKIGYHCENCGKKYNNQFEIDNKSCMSCQTNHENKKINDLIQEMRSNIGHNYRYFDMMFEWIPYDQFNDIKAIVMKEMIIAGKENQIQELL